MLIKTPVTAPNALPTVMFRATAWYRKPAAEVSFKRSPKHLGNHDGWPPGPRNGPSR